MLSNFHGSSLFHEAIIKTTDKRKVEFLFCNKCKVAVKLTYTKIQLSQKHYWVNIKMIDHKYRFWILKILVLLADIDCLLDQTTKQPLSNLEPRKPWTCKQLWGLRPDPSCLLKKLSVIGLAFWRFSLNKLERRGRFRL